MPTMRYVRPKRFYIAMWVLAYLTKYPYSTASEIVGANGQYEANEMRRVLDDLEATGWIICEDGGGRRGYRAAEPLVLR